MINRSTNPVEWHVVSPVIHTHHMLPVFEHLSQPSSPSPTIVIVEGFVPLKVRSSAMIPNVCDIELIPLFDVQHEFVQVETSTRLKSIFAGN